MARRGSGDPLNFYRMVTKGCTRSGRCGLRFTDHVDRTYLRICTFCLAESHQFLKIPCWILGDLVDYLGIDTRGVHTGVTQHSGDGI